MHYKGVKAVFLDRDGTINDNSDYYVFSPKRFIFNDGAVEAMKKFYSKGYSLFIISNQSGIAKGIYSVNNVESLHKYMITELNKQGVEIVDIFYCPHHPDYGNCLCRKPESLLIEKAIAKYSVSISESFFIGDSERDVVAAEKVGIKAIKINSNQSLLSICNKIP